MKKDHANVYFPPPMIHLIAILAGTGIAEFYPLVFPWQVTLAALGTGLLIVSLLIAESAFREFKHRNNPVPPNKPVNQLMEGGPFRWSRNPLYLALSLLQAGIGLISGNGWMLILLVPAVALVSYYVIAREEAYLARRFGQSYLDYQSRVRRWL